MNETFDERDHPSPGRNDPCWCGSGKKYKKCHLDRDAGAPASVGVASAEFNGLRRRLGDFLGEMLSEKNGATTMAEFFTGTPEEEEMGLFTDWLIHDWTIPELGHGLIAEFLRRSGSSLTQRERSTAELWAQCNFGLYEVHEVREGSGIEVIDVFNGETLFIHDVNTSKKLVTWDGLLARVVPAERGLELSGMAMTIPRTHLKTLQEAVQEEQRRSGLSMPQYLKRNLPRVRAMFYEISEDWMRSLRMQNNDGEEICFCESTYRVTGDAAVVLALRGHTDISEVEAGRTYSWLKAAAGKDRLVLGTIRLDAGKLVMECNSRKRCERGKRLLAEIAGTALRHVRDEITTQAEMKRRVMERPRQPAAREISHMAPTELIQRAMEQHYREWIDTPLPVLAGQSPREAVRTPRGRDEVMALLRNIENGELHKKKSGDPYFDVCWLREQLGVHESE